MTQSVRPPAVLVVNDDSASLLGLTGLLERWSSELDYEVVGVSSGEAALREVLSREFAAILLDVNMPGMDGFETAELIHARPASSSTPIIFVTAYWSDEVVRVKAYQNGAVDYLFTPVVPEMLRAKVSVFVGLAKKTLKLKEQAELLERRTEQLERMNVMLREEIEGRIEAERRDREKDELLAMLGHELRNPLAAISSAAGLLQEAQASSQSRSFAAEVIQRQSDALGGIVDDLLNLGRVLYGRVSLERKPADLAQLVQASLDTFGLAGRISTHELSAELSPAWAEVDVVRFEQIVGNLIDNAIKYTPAGGSVKVRAGSSEGQAWVEVSDSGVGIEPELLPRVFDTFVQGGPGGQGGLGIGLALVRQLVTMHGGSVDAESDGAGHGSRFTVRLPALDATAVPVASLPMADDSSLQGCRVLLVDDNDDVRDTLALVLESLGCVVTTASGGAAALELLQAGLPQVALVDIGMPGMDGYELARRVREAGHDLRMIALTGFGTETAFRQMEAAGFEAHLVKPVRMEELRRTLLQQALNVG